MKPRLDLAGQRWRPPYSGWWGAVVYAIEAELSGVGAGWTDITPDARHDPWVLTYGIRGNGPEDLVAETGTFTWSMCNDATNSASIIGYYSIGHPLCRAGWAEDIRVRLSVYVGGRVIRRWRGRLDEAIPTPGVYGDLAVACTAVDFIDQLASAPADVAVQVGKTDAQIAAAILAASPVAPAATIIDASVDTYPYALDQEESSLLGAAQALALSARSYLYHRCDRSEGETIRHESRTARQVAARPTLSLPDTVLTNMTRTSREQTYDRWRVTLHPRQVIARASMAGPVALETTVPTTPLAPGASEEIWLDFTDPVQRDTRIAAANCLTPVATTDYLYNTAADGSGTNITASVTVAATFFGTSAKLTFTNGHATLSGYRIKNQVRGDGIYSLSDVTVEKKNGLGRKLRELDMPYQGDPSVGAGVAQSLLPIYLTRMPETVTFDASRDRSTLIAALLTDIGDSIDVSETVTGTARRCFVNGVQLVIDGVDNLEVTYWTAPAMDPAWVVGTDAVGEGMRVGA